jgi:hypothetical protein
VTLPVSLVIPSPSTKAMMVPLRNSSWAGDVHARALQAHPWLLGDAWLLLEAARMDVSQARRPASTGILACGSRGISCGRQGVSTSMVTGTWLVMTS